MKNLLSFIVMLWVTLVLPPIIFGSAIKPGVIQDQTVTMSYYTKPELLAFNANKVTLNGTVRLVGNRPFSRLALTIANEQDIYLQLPSRMIPKSYLLLQTKFVQISGTLYYEKLQTPDEKYSRDEFRLHPNHFTIISMP